MLSVHRRVCAIEWKERLTIGGGCCPPAIYSIRKRGVCVRELDTFAMYPFEHTGIDDLHLGYTQSEIFSRFDTSRQ